MAKKGVSNDFVAAHLTGPRRPKEAVTFSKLNMDASERAQPGASTSGAAAGAPLRPGGRTMPLQYYAGNPLVSLS